MKVQVTLFDEYDHPTGEYIIEPRIAMREHAITDLKDWMFNEIDGLCLGSPVAKIEIKRL